jgi:pyruvate,water dikinase
MFFLGGKGMRKVRGARRLVTEIPIALYILDLGNGIRDDPSTRKQVDLKDVENMGLRALWKGLSHPEILWSPEVLHFDWKEFDRVSAGVISLDSQLLASFAVLSKDYLNVNIRFGYHFVVIDALFGSDLRENYILLRFKGGGALPEQTHLRVRFLAKVLRKHGFETDFEGDTINARRRGGSLPGMEKKLEMLGFLLGFTRLLDMKIKDMGGVEAFADEFLTRYPPE